MKTIARPMFIISALMVPACAAPPQERSIAVPVSTPSASPPAAASLETPEFEINAPGATLDIDVAVTVNTFKPLRIFGNNVPAWVDPVPVKAKIEAAGNYLLRIPGGSWGDVYHWNSKGSFDTQGQWAPSDTEYAESVLEKDYTAKYFSSRASDGNDKTAWMSHPETDYPNAQWMYLDFGQAKEVDEADITWGNVADKSFPYAKKFSVQYWNPADGRQWMVYGAVKSAWVDIKANVKGTRGVQKVNFTKTKTQYLRIVLQESSAGKDGVYSVAEYRALAEGKPVALASSSPCVASSASSVSSGFESRKVFGFEQYMDFLNSFVPKKAIPLVIVNFGTPQEAAAWVHYANKVKGYGIKYWEIGNEVGGHWEAGGPVNVRDYARRYIQFYEAMKKEDPSVTIVAQTGYSDASGLYDEVPSLKDFVDRLAKDKKEKYLDAFSVHQYPNWNQPVADLLNSPSSAMAEMASSIKSQLAPYSGLADVPVWISEFNTSDHVIPDISVRIDNGLWLAQYLGEFIRNFGLRGYATLWDVMNGGNAIKDPKGGDHGYLQAEEGPYQYQERADYWTMRLMAATWAMAADDQDHRLVQSTSSESFLATYATLRPDGQLALLVVNKDLQNAYRAAIHIKGFTPASKAQAWMFDARNYHWNTDGVPYHADPDRPPTSVAVEVTPTGPEFTFPAYSMTVLRFEKASK